MSIKVLVTGSREFDNYQLVYDMLDQVWLTKPASGMIVIHGAARGADSIADVWATNRDAVTVVRCPANWKMEGRFAAGPKRNRRMLELGPDLVLAFFQRGAGNRGTKNMVGQSKNAGIEVREYWSDEVD